MPTSPHADIVAANLETILDQCGSFEEETDDGASFTGQIDKVSFPDIAGADQQVNYQLTGETGGVTVSAAMIGIQVRHYVSFDFWIDLGSFDPDAVADVATTAVAKLGT